MRYSTFKLPSWFHAPDLLQQTLYKAWNQHYRELYEETSEQLLSLEETLEIILHQLQSSNDGCGHLRCGWMALALSLAVQPTVESYLPGDPRPQLILETITAWLEGKNISAIPSVEELFPQASVGPQAIDEALDVFRNLLRVIDPQQVHQALMEILDDCLEGYAIFPGSSERRNLFNWWLIEVVPAAWCQRLPEAIYTLA